MLKPHIVILGAGFGGMYVAKDLVPLVKKGEIDLTIVSRTNYFLFTPLLHEVATGGLSPSSVAEPLREVFVGTGVQICQGDVVSVNTADRRVTVSGIIPTTLHYDFLVLATGAETNYYNIPGAEKFSYPLKTIKDAENIRAAVIEAFEKAVYDLNPTERLKQLSFVVVGGGATGVEVAAELAEFVEGIVTRYYQDTNRCKAEEPAVSLVHAGKELLEQFSPPLRQAAADRLKENGVILHTGAVVTSVTQNGLTLGNNTTLQASTIIWAAGVRPSVPHFEDISPAVLSDRLKVDEFFFLEGSDRIFALGDVAAYTPAVPMLAQAAVLEASVVGRNIRAVLHGKKLKTFTFRSKGSLVSVGQWFAIGEIFSLQIAGKFTWWLWRMVYLFKFISMKKRLRIVIEWTLNVFSSRDITVK